MEEAHTTQGRARRIRILVVLAVCILVGIGVFAPRPPEKEPEYDGRKLSDWLGVESRYRSDSTEGRAAVEAVRHIGTNALPSVLRWIGYKHPRWKKVALGYANHIPPPLDSVTDWVIDNTFISDDKEIDRIDYGLRCLRLLGPEAEPAIPELVRMADQKDPHVSNSAVIGLLQIGQKSLGPLVQMLEDPTHGNRDMAFLALASLGQKARPAVPVLLRACGGSTFKLRDSATNVLLIIAPEALTNGVSDANL